VLTEAIPGQAQHPITHFTRPWDNFMVNGVNNPLRSKKHLGTIVKKKIKEIKILNND
jgi:hypothetical protein